MARTERGSDKPRGLVGRLTVYAGLLLAAVLCIGAQLDHAVESRPGLARLVFPPFEGLAHAVSAERALTMEMQNASLREARALALARPTASESFSRLARAYALQGDGEGAQRAILASAARGWRDPLAQLVILQAALGVEDWDVVAQRLTALRKMRRDHQFFDEKLVQLASIDRGRQVLAEQLAADPMGQRQFMRDGLNLLPPEQFTQILVESAKGQDEINCDTFTLATERLLRAGDKNNAMKTWLPSCRNSANLSSDISFERIVDTGAPAPFAWRYPRSSGLSSFPTTGKDGGIVLQFANNSRLNRVVAERFLTLEPGEHRIEISTAGTATVQRGRNTTITPAVQCMGERRSFLDVREDAGRWTVLVPQEGCEVQNIQIVATPGTETVTAVAIS